MATKTVLEKLQTAVDNERVGQSVLDLLGELGDVREWAEALTELADNIEMAEDALQTYVDAEGREEKADAKEEAVSALGTVIESWESATALAAVDGLVAQP